MNNSAHFLPVFVCQPKPLSLNSKHIYFVMINNVFLEIEKWICVYFIFYLGLIEDHFLCTDEQMIPTKQTNIEFNLTMGMKIRIFCFEELKNMMKKRRRTKVYIGEKNRVCGIEVFGISQIYKVLNSILYFGQFRLSPRNPHPSFVS